MPFTEPENPGRVVAKFYVTELAWRQWGVEVKLQAVTRGEDNKMWASATPVGNLTMTIKNEVAAEQFAPGQEWLLEMVPVPKDAVGQEGMGAA